MKLIITTLVFFISANTFSQALYENQSESFKSAEEHIQMLLIEGMDVILPSEDTPEAMEESYKLLIGNSELVNDYIKKLISANQHLSKTVLLRYENFEVIIDPKNK